MKLLLFTSLFISTLAFSSESISLYAQGCLPYKAPNGDSVLNCLKERIIKIELDEVANDFFEGRWEKTLDQDETTYLIGLTVNKTISNGVELYLTDAKIEISGKIVTSVSAVLNLSDSATNSFSLTSHQGIGSNGGFPHFFYGIPDEVDRYSEKKVFKRRFYHKN